MDDFLACTSSDRLVISLMSGFVFFQLHSFLWLHFFFFFLLVAHMGVNEHCAWKCNFHINSHVNVNDLHAEIIYTSTYFKAPFFVLNLNLHYWKYNVDNNIKIIFSLNNHNYLKYPIIIFEVQKKRNNEKLTRRKISFQVTKRFCFCLFSLDPSYFQTS
jgi:hypothetical protein